MLCCDTPELVAKFQQHKHDHLLHERPACVAGLAAHAWLHLCCHLCHGIWSQSDLTEADLLPTFMLLPGLPAVTADRIMATHHHRQRWGCPWPAAQLLMERVFFAEVGFHIWCRFAQGGDLEDWLINIREKARIDFPSRAHECVPYTAPQQAQAVSMIRDIFQVCSAPSPCDLLTSACCRCSIPILSCSPEKSTFHLARLPIHDCSY